MRFVALSVAAIRYFRCMSVASACHDQCRPLRRSTVVFVNFFDNRDNVDMSSQTLELRSSVSNVLEARLCCAICFRDPHMPRTGHKPDEKITKKMKRKTAPGTCIVDIPGEETESEEIHTNIG